MLYSLRKKLALICIIITGVLLSATAAGLVFLTEKQLDRQSAITFQNNLNSIIYKLQTGQTIDNMWLSQLEAGNRLIVHIEDGGSPILFPGSWKPKTHRDELIRKAQRLALQNYNFDIKKRPTSAVQVNSVTFSVKGNYGDRYQAATATFSAGGGWQSVTLLRDLSTEQNQRLIMGLSFLGLIGAALILLFAFSWWLSGRAIQPIEESRRRQAEFVAAASHELRSPLAVIRASIWAASDPVSHSKFLDTANRECHRMARLIDDLLLLASADADTWSIHTEKIEPDTLMIQLYESFQPMAAENGQSIRLELPEESLCQLHGDSQRLFQALSILVDNALSYTPDQGQILLRLREETGTGSPVPGSRRPYLLFSVADDGPGIPDDQKERIFDRFYRADPSRSKKEHYGLGLSVAREIIQRQGGTITVKDGPLEGAVFTIRLPAL